MRLLTILFLFFLAFVAALAANGPGDAKAPAAAPNGIELPEGYLDWRVLSVSSRSDNGTIRVILGNEAAAVAAETGETQPWPDGAILCKLVWKQTEHEAWPTAGVPGEFVHAEFMVKDSELHVETGGWGFARWLGVEQTPYGSGPSFANSCFACHLPVAEQDYVFTRPATVPIRAAQVVE
jgi:hypothetical protein